MKLNATAKRGSIVCHECPAMIFQGEKYSLAPDGSQWVRRCQACAVRAARRQAARDRAQAMRDLGMVRNRNGSWE